MKKLFSALMILTVVALGVLGLCACQPAPVGDVVGTYELTKFTRSYPDKMPEAEEGQDAPEQTYTTRDYIKEYEMKMYLVVGKDGVGYTVYQDKDTPLTLRTVRIEFTKDSDDANKISRVEYSDKVTNNSGAPIPEKSLYVNAGKEMQLKKDDPIYNGILIKRDYSQDILFTKVSSATDLSFVSDKTGKELVGLAYELQGLDGLLAAYGLYGDERSDYVYYAIRFDAANLTAKRYYRTKTADRGTEETVSVTYMTGEDNKLLFTIGDLETYTYYYAGSGSPTSLFCDGTEERSGLGFYHTNDTVGDYIQGEERLYAEWLETFANTDGE
ncbi:MAG: hypothetical protein IJ735_05045 [Clostridia bacterium]|nr:hypothetical protein [Clostridia bacterium]